MKKKKKKDWYKVKKYPHIGLPLKIDDRYKWIQKYVTTPEEIKKHSFLPFIHKTSKVRKYRKTYSSKSGELLKITDSIGNHLNRKKDIKERELYYASHLDSLIFSYYSHELAKLYEEKLAEYNLLDVVTAYRAIPIVPSNENSSNKCNIDFANDIFNYIRQYVDDEFIVICFDIKSFFDNLNHKRLRNAWCKVLGVSILPPDHFNVFKNITRFSYVDIVDLFEKFKEKIFIQKRNNLGQLLPIKRGKVSKVKFLRNQHAIAFCTKEEFFKHKNELLKNYKYKRKDGILKERDYGIPQGSPISSILANIYLLEFDKKINDFLGDSGIYRRYSDDMVVVCKLSDKQGILDLIYESISEYDLEIQKSKTQVFHFKKDQNRLQCGQEFEDGINWNKNFIYLGFEFDGKTVLLKSASISGYYRKMKRSVKRAKMHSLGKFNKNHGHIFKRRLLKKFSYKGAGRRRKWMWDEKEKKFVKSEHFDWGNFLSYAKKASESMIDNKIKNQVQKHWNKLNKIIKE